MNTNNVWEYQYLGGHIALEQYLGVHGNVFGGDVLRFIDETAALFACFIIEDKMVVTKKFGDTIFHNKVKLGDLVKFYGKVTKIGNTSVCLKIMVMKTNPRNGKEKDVCSTDVIFVRIDEDGDPMAIAERLKNKYLAQKKKKSK